MMMRASLFVVVVVVVVLSHECVSVFRVKRERERAEKEKSSLLHFWEEKREAEPHARERGRTTINTYIWKALFYFFGRGASFPTRTRRIKKRVFVSLSLLFVLF